MPPNVLLLMIDAFRADRCWGSTRTCRTPVLDELRRRSTLFVNAYSTASTTTICASSLLTSSYPFVHGIRSLADRRLRPDLPTLAEAFKAAGYHTWAEVTGPLEPVTGLDRGFDDYCHRPYQQWLDTSFGDRLIGRLRDRSPRPWFGFVHLWELHHPRRVTPPYRGSEYGRTLYDRAVSSLDHQLGRLLPLPEDTILVVTGDHGEHVAASDGADAIGRLKRPFKLLKQWVPGIRKLKRLSPALFKTLDRAGQKNNDLYFQWLGHGYHIYDYLTHVPLFIHGPGLFPEGAELPHLVSHVDIFPTLLSALDLPMRPPPLLSGVDLMPVVQQPTRSLDRDAIYMEAGGGRVLPNPDQRIIGLRTERYKFVRGPLDAVPAEELYDLQQDPGERENLIDSLPAVAADLRSRLAAFLEAELSPSFKMETAYSPEELSKLTDRLRDLGYLASYILCGASASVAARWVASVPHGSIFS